MRPRYRFSHRGMDDRYYWESSPIRGDSRIESVSCDVRWFWDGSGTPSPEPIRHPNSCSCAWCYTAAMGGGR